MVVYGSLGGDSSRKKNNVAAAKGRCHCGNGHEKDGMFSSPKTFTPQRGLSTQELYLEYGMNFNETKRALPRGKIERRFSMPALHPYPNFGPVTRGRRIESVLGEVASGSGERKTRRRFLEVLVLIYGGFHLRHDGDRRETWCSLGRIRITVCSDTLRQCSRWEEGDVKWHLIASLPNDWDTFKVALYEKAISQTFLAIAVDIFVEDKRRRDISPTRGNIMEGPELRPAVIRDVTASSIRRDFATFMQSWVQSSEGDPIQVDSDLEDDVDPDDGVDPDDDFDPNDDLDEDFDLDEDSDEEFDPQPPLPDPQPSHPPAGPRLFGFSGPRIRQTARKSTARMSTARMSTARMSVIEPSDYMRFDMSHERASTDGDSSGH
ncbi:hypothetical protein CCACVL1_09537 [Corchorus capsularis]|uniref:Uncharacterized protein n=1 Tax=Corchorus capsularis TaxID=210143 RepID=A0A1R3IVR6_COCAP|nr:hypothetical protein CCACVL1_09537 [Corchorus capsularis]